MVITHKINLDLQEARSIMPVIRTVQDDKYSRDLELTLTSGGQAWNPPAGATVVVRCRKPDGTSCNYDMLPDGAAAYSILANAVTVKLAPQVLTVPGRVSLSVAIVSGEAQLHTFPMELEVQANPGLSPASDNYYNIAGTLPATGWEPEMYLGTDAAGKVVAKAMLPGNVTPEQLQEAVDTYLDAHGVAPGATAEQAAQIEKNRQDIAAIPVKVAGDGYTDISGLRQLTAMSVVKAGSTVTVTSTVSGGIIYTDVIHLDESERPTKIISDGVEIHTEWSGFDGT